MVIDGLLKVGGRVFLQTKDDVCGGDVEFFQGVVITGNGQQPVLLLLQSSLLCHRCAVCVNILILIPVMRTGGSLVFESNSLCCFYYDYIRRASFFSTRTFRTFSSQEWKVHHLFNIPGILFFLFCCASKTWLVSDVSCFVSYGATFSGYLVP